MARLPPNAEDWPFEAKQSALSEYNTASDLRDEIDNIVGLNRDYPDTGALQFTKTEAAAILLALGGLDGGDD